MLTNVNVQDAAHEIHSYFTDLKEFINWFVFASYVLNQFFVLFYDLFIKSMMLTFS